MSAIPLKRRSAGLLMYHCCGGEIEVFLVHPGGPFFVHRDEGSWTVPKGLIDPGEEEQATARREFAEETGQRVEDLAVSDGMLELGTIVQRGGKVVVAWAFEGEWPEGVELQSNTFSLEWPRGSGRRLEVPEVDRGEFFPLPAARRKINPAQRPFLERLLDHLGIN
jgi:predicted NUDIX family NTP pyrophosphohydrolase